MTAPIRPLVKSLDGRSARELFTYERTTDNGGETPPPPSGIQPVVVPLPFQNGGDVDVFLTPGSGETDTLWPVERYDSTGNNQVRVVTNVETAGASGAELFAQYSLDGSTWITPGVTDVRVAIGATGARPNANQGWVDLTPFAIGDVLWKIPMRGGDGVASPALWGTMLQFRQKTVASPTPPTDLPTGVWGDVIFDIDADGARFNALGLADGDDVNFWPDESGFGNDMTTDAALLLPKYRATGFNGSRPCVEWAGSNVPLLTPKNPSAAYGNWTYYLVLENLDGSADGAVIWGDQGNGSFSYRLYAYNDKISAACNNAFGTPTDITDSWTMADAHIYRFVKSSDNSQWYVFVDGVEVKEVDNAPQGNDSIGNQLMNLISGLGLTGRVRRLVGYNKAHLSPTNVGTIPADGFTAPETSLADDAGTTSGGGGGGGSPPGTKPAYLGTTTDPTYGNTITRITGDVGVAIPGGGGLTWPNVAYHNYSKDQPWSADEAYIALKQVSNIAGPGTTVILDGTTYAFVLATTGGTSGGGEWRWHPTVPDETIILNSSGAVKWWNPITDVTTLKVAAVAGYTSNEMGPFEGNPSKDGAYLVAKATRSSDGHTVARVININAGTTGAVIDITAAGVTALDWVSISAGGGYVVAYGTISGVSQSLAIWTRAGALVGSYTTDRMGHLDLGINDVGDEVAFSVVASGSNAKKAIMRRLSDGAVTILSGADSTFNYHCSTRSLDEYGAVSVNDSTGQPWDGQNLLVKMSASPVIVNLGGNFTNNTDYDSGAKLVMSPSGTRGMFASNWGATGSPPRPVQCYVVDV